MTAKSQNKKKEVSRQKKIRRSLLSNRIKVVLQWLSSLTTLWNLMQHKNQNSE